jgi:GH15 family glucan-1,4-alpha-glucosidase
VRVGNSANGQLQLDIYGQLVQTAYHFVCNGGSLNEDQRELLVAIGRTVCRLWREPDHSIWESRGAPRHHTYSKLMCWVALDRLIALARRGTLELDQHALRRERDEIREAIESRGYDERVGSYVGYFGDSSADASLLLMLRYGYVEPGDERMRSTHRYITEQLSENGLLFRYPPGQRYDGVDGSEHAFVACNFWEVDYLARNGEVDAATWLFERLLALANDVGLYAEQVDARSGEAFGNFPQAFSHSGLVTAALAIEQARAGRRGAQISA